MDHRQVLDLVIRQIRHYHSRVPTSISDHPPPFRTTRHAHRSISRRLETVLCHHSHLTRLAVWESVSQLRHYYHPNRRVYPAREYHCYRQNRPAIQVDHPRPRPTHRIRPVHHVHPDHHSKDGSRLNRPALPHLPVTMGNPQRNAEPRSPSRTILPLSMGTSRVERPSQPTHLHHRSPARHLQERRQARHWH